MKYSLKVLLMMIFLVQVISLTAQERELKFGIRGVLQNNQLDQHSYSRDNWTVSNNSATSLGVFAEWRKWKVNFDAIPKSMNLDLNYFLGKELFLMANAKWFSLDYEVPDFNDYSGRVMNDLNLFTYNAGVGIETKVWGRLQFKGAIMGGIMHSNKEESFYCDYSYGKNKRRRITNTYQLDPTFVYGGMLSLELLPSRKNSRKRALVPFMSFSYLQNHKSRTYLQVEVEEWVAGNMVYREDNGKNNKSYDLEYIQFQFGLKWYLKK